MPAVPANNASELSWKDWAGRSAGGDAYQFGDVTRFLWHKLQEITHLGSPDRGRSQAAQASVDDADRALLDLKVQRDQLVGYRKRAEKQLARDEEAAWTLMQAKKKERAMLALRKKKHHQQLVMECEQNIGKLEELIDSIELARVQQDIVAALAAGVKTLRKVQQEIGGADYINQLMDEREEAMEAQQEINEALAGVGVAADDADALAELARLEASMVAAAASTAQGAAPVRPSAQVAGGDSSPAEGAPASLVAATAAPPPLASAASARTPAQQSTAAARMPVVAS